MTFRLFFSVLLLCVLASDAHAAIIFTPPEGLHPREVPQAALHIVSSLKKYSTDDELIQVSVAAQAPAKSEGDVVNITAGLITGMSKKGLIIESDVKIDYKGLPGKHIKGKVPMGDEYGSFLSDSFIIFGSKTTYILNLNQHETVNDLSLRNKILDRVSISDTPPTLNPSKSPTPSAQFQAGEKIGYYGFFVLLSVFAFLAIRKRLVKKS